MRLTSIESGEEFAYHAPCYARNRGLDRQALELFADRDDVTVEDVGESCSGISGTCGWKAKQYDRSMEIGEEMFERMDDAAGEAGMTECPTLRCGWNTVPATRFASPSDCSKRHSSTAARAERARNEIAGSQRTILFVRR